MLAVGILVRIVKTIGDKVISKSRFYNTFNYLGYEREDTIEEFNVDSKAEYSAYLAHVARN